MDINTTANVVQALWPMFAALAVCLAALLAGWIRIQMRVTYLEKDLVVHKITQEKELTIQKSEAGSSAKALWDKVDGMQTSMNSVLQGFGRVEGKVDALFQRDH